MTREEIDKIASDYLNDCESEFDMLEVFAVAKEALAQEPCEDAISRQAALDCFTATKLKKFDFILYAREEIKKLPSVIPAEKIGRWIKTIGENGVTSAVRCSKCGFEDNRYMLFRYCPNCGQPKMQEVEE